MDRDFASEDPEFLGEIADEDGRKDSTLNLESVSKTHSFAGALDFASRLYAHVVLRDLRSHTAIRMFCGSLAIAVRAARREPETTNAMCRKLGIKGRRLEVRVTRLIAGRRNGQRQDQIARWANAAAYVARPLNGDEAPGDWREAARYIARRGGIRPLSNLYAQRTRGGAIDHTFLPMDGTAFYGVAGDNSTYEWFTPEYVFIAFGCTFDLDPASPGRNVVPWIPARHHFTIHEDGLCREWFGFVWLNPPFGKLVMPRWLEKFVVHGNGIALVPERTSTAWWQNLASHADMILVLNKKIPFINRAGEQTSAFPIGTHLIGIGELATAALIRAHRHGLGMLLRPYAPFT
jgi:DNA N-6-adenine-methyltransferase Dam